MCFRATAVFSAPQRRAAEQTLEVAAVAASAAKALSTLRLTHDATASSEDDTRRAEERWRRKSQALPSSNSGGATSGTGGSVSMTGSGSGNSQGGGVSSSGGESVVRQGRPQAQEAAEAPVGGDPWCAEKKSAQV